MIFSRVKNASACIILTAATIKQVTEKTNEIIRTHQIKTASCYHNANNKLRCIAVFCPRKEVPDTQIECNLHQPYSNYQNGQQGRGFTVFQRKIYMKGSCMFEDVCYQKNRSFTVHDDVALSIRNLVSTIERKEQRGFYLTDGNARLEGNNIVYSAVFSTQRYGMCDYRVISNVNAFQLYERYRVLAWDGYHLTTIIPTTGNLTPQFIAVFWK